MRPPPSCIVPMVPRVFIAFAVGVALLASGCGSKNSLVGGACANGYAQSGNQCLPVDASSPSQDGGTGDATVPSIDGSAPDSDASPDSTAPVDSGPSADGSQPDAGCAPPTPTNCNGVCVDLTSDENNCGTCGNVCPTLICQASVCSGQSAAHIIVMGHDFSAPTLSGISISQQTLLLNSVNLAIGNPIQVWGFEQYADSNAISNVKQILSDNASGRTIVYNAADSTQIQNGLSSRIDLLIIYSQVSAPPGTMGSLGTSWQTSFSQFLASGGIIIVMDGAVTTDADGSAEMPIFTSNADLLQMSGDSPLSNGMSLYVTAPGDAIANGVGSPYSAVINSANLFVTEVPDSGVITSVVSSGQPASSTNTVVVHKALFL